MPLENEYGALALESTLDALKTIADSLLLAVSAIQATTEALNAKAVTLDTAHVAGSVDIDNFPETQPVSGTVSVSNMISQGLTDTQLRAADVKVSLDSEQVTIANFPVTQPVSGTVAVSNMVLPGLTDTQLRATPLPVSGTISVSNQPSQPLTDTQLRAADVKVTLDGEQVTVSNFPATQPVSGSVSVSNMITQGLTDAELRATPLPVSGTVAVSNQLAQPLTDTQLRASALTVAVNNSNLAAEESIQELQAIEQRLKTLNANIQRLSFDTTSQMRVLVSSLPTLPTVTTVSTCNNSFGDAGKPSAAILTAFQAFQLGVGANFSRS